MASSSELLCIPVFAGQGTNAASSPATRQQALSDAKLPCCSVLLVACFQAFVSELLTLSSSALDEIQVSLSEFTTKESLLAQDERYLYNPVITGPTLFLVQVLRYLAFTEGDGGSTKSHASFGDILKSNKKHDVGILGFSSGILPACVVSSSNTVIDFISRAVETFRLALWIGIRSQLYRKKTLSLCTPSVQPSLPWSLVFFGLSRQAAEAALEKFNKVIKRSLCLITERLNLLPCAGIRNCLSLLDGRHGRLFCYYIRSPRHLGNVFRYFRIRRIHS